MTNAYTLVGKDSSDGYYYYTEYAVRLLPSGVLRAITNDVNRTAWLVDLPANATGDIATWLQDVATADLIEEMGLDILAIGVVTPQAGSARSVVQWITTLGDRASYLIALNRDEYEPVVRVLEEEHIGGAGSETERYLRIAILRYLLLGTHDWTDEVIERLLGDVRGGVDPARGEDTMVHRILKEMR